LIHFYKRFCRTKMSLSSIFPESDKPAIYYKQKVSWKISEQDWNSHDELCLRLKIAIPGSHHEVSPGGCIFLEKARVGFATFWPKDVENDKIRIFASFSLKTNDGGFSVNFKADYRYNTIAANNAIGVYVQKMVKVKPENLYDEERTFTFEADLFVEMNDPEKDSFKMSDAFMEDIESIFQDVKNSDVLVRAEDQEFKCHKNILSARSEVFKNTLAHDTIESESNTIVVREVPAIAVEDMLKYIYTGKLPADPKRLTFDLLNAAEMYQIPSLKEACMQNLVESLDVPSCISTFILVDRFLPHGGEVREKVVKFMMCKAAEVVDLEACDKLVDTYPSLTKELMKAIGKKGSKEKHRCQFCVVSYKRKRGHS